MDIQQFCPMAIMTGDLILIMSWNLYLKQTGELLHFSKSFAHSSFYENLPVQG